MDPFFLFAIFSSLLFFPLCYFFLFAILWFDPDSYPLTVIIEKDENDEYHSDSGNFQVIGFNSW
jgi:hypothetical protein